MFFAETLGPVMTAHLTNELYQFVKARVKAPCSAEDMRAAVNEFLRSKNIRANADALIGQLERGGYVALGPVTAGHRYQFAA